ncbi:putative spherulin [Cladophialophora carrionii]|uniref:Putative spherulin n=1 Tax=Cladophialophora carrionii TaxID=86049 RepID=A0A1C1CZC0_9EURO|nr:putative spherulin [Cladophialophora carrionii]
MHSTSLLVAAFAAVAAASPMAPSQTWATSYGSGSGKPTGTGGSSTSLVTGLLGNPDATPNPKPTDGTIAKLLTEDSRVDRFTEIQAEIAAGNFNLKFDFNPNANPPNPAALPLGGQVDLANRKNFPLLTGLGISAAGIFFEPCGLNTPHIHPDATEFFTVVTDNTISTGFVLENGFTTEQRTNLTLFQGTAFPMGSIHWQQNLDCKPAVAIAGLNSEDPGASSIAQNFLINTSADIVDAALGFPKQIDQNNFADFRANIPVSLARGVEECLIRCGLKY